MHLNVPVTNWQHLSWFFVFFCCRSRRDPPPPKGSCPKTKPPPLLSLHRPPTSSLGGPNMRGPHISHSGPSSSRGPLLHTAPPFHPGSRGPHGIRGAPPSLKSARLPLLASPGRLLPPPPASSLRSYPHLVSSLGAHFSLWTNNCVEQIPSYCWLKSKWLWRFFFCFVLLAD